MNSRRVLNAIIAANRGGRPLGIASWCTAQPDVLRAIFRGHRDSAEAILIEATCNQVNQDGGYTGMTPLAFRTFVEGLARQTGVDAGRIILGGDHLGPNPWRNLPANEAMAKARDMVRDYVEAGFTKIHLDASMACADDLELPDTLMAERAAELCAAAEATGRGGQLTYVVGTEVPVPGGETSVLDTLAVTRPELAERTYELHRTAFAGKDLAEAAGRIVAIVVQPGVDFGNSQVFAFDRAKAAALSAAVSGIPDVVYEAHSTDYQSPAALAGLVASHFAILKVGPELTFAFREAVFAMAEIEQRLMPVAGSGIADAIAGAMDADPRHWQNYIESGKQQQLMRLYGLSDRIRYYWPDPRVGVALAVLRENIDRSSVPPGLLAQFAGTMRLDDEALPLSDRIIQYKVGAIVAKYRAACGLDSLV